MQTKIIDGDKVIADSHILIPDNPDPQKIGSIITYYRRYSLQSLLLLQAQDDDGNLAIQQPKTVQQKSSEVTYQPTQQPRASNNCKDCGGATIPGKNGKPYCKPCYIKWANVNKPKTNQPQLNQQGQVPANVPAHALFNGAKAVDEFPAEYVDDQYVNKITY